MLILETWSCLHETLLSISKDLVQADFSERLRLSVTDSYSIIQSSGRDPYVLEIAREPNGLYNFHSCCNVVEVFLLSNFLQHFSSKSPSLLAGESNMKKSEIHIK